VTREKERGRELAGTDGVDQTARQAPHDRLGTMGIHLERPGVGQQGRLAFHCARKADAGWLLREFQRAQEPRSSASIMPDQDHELGSMITASDGSTRRWLSHTSGLCGQSLYYTRSSARPRPAPSIACASTHHEKETARAGYVSRCRTLNLNSL
jgi:hypothetical protein